MDTTGSVEVISEDEHDSPVIARLEKGDFFGEVARLADQPRNATINAKEDVQLYSLDKAGFRAAIDGSPTLKEQLLKVFFQRQ